MKSLNNVGLIVLTAVFVFGVGGLIRAATSVSLNTVDGFAVLAGSGITNTGPTTITGDVGSFPTTTQTGFSSVTLNGINHTGDSIAQGAKIDLVTAYNNVAGQTPASTVPAELGGTTKTAGVYNSTDGTFAITGTLTLDAQGNPNAVFIFNMASTLVTAGSSGVVLVNGAQACNVFWQVGSSATLGTNSSFIGNILALTSATLTTGTSVNGRVLARNGAVTLDSNIITKSVCLANTPTATPVATATPTPSSVPSPSSLPTPVPKLPNTGVVSDGRDVNLGIMVLVGLVAISTFAFSARKKQTV